jgi:hypothetical protein
MSTKLSDRVKRFFRALNAKITDQDKLVIDSYLEENHKKLFYSMRIIDQRHCLDVANTLINSGKNVSKTTMQLALLHDIGKQVKPFYLLERVLVVVFPRKQLKLPIEPLLANPLKKAWQIKYWHPEYGARLAEKELFDSFLTELIRLHHNLPAKYQEIEDFQWSDNQN